MDGAKFYNFSFALFLNSFSSEVGLSTLAMAESSECPDVENREGNEGVPRGLPRSQSERFLAVCKAHVQQERELQEKYYDNLFATVEKVMKSSQSNQLKTLRVLLDRETADVMRKLQATRHGEVLYLVTTLYILSYEKNIYKKS